MKAGDAYKLYDYAKYMNTETVPEITRYAEAYRNAMASPKAAQKYLSEAMGFDFYALRHSGFHMNDSGHWAQLPLGKKPSKEQQVDALKNFQNVHTLLVKATASLRDKWGGSEEIAKNIMEKAGFTRLLYSNEPDYADPSNSNGITSKFREDDDEAGGNYSGTGKLSSAAPKQVIVNITNLLSVGAIKLFKSEDGQFPEIQDLKEELAQALIDVVHDFDASWNG